MINKLKNSNLEFKLKTATLGKDIVKIIKIANNKILIIDNYVDDSILDILTKKKQEYICSWKYFLRSAEKAD